MSNISKKLKVIIGICVVSISWVISIYPFCKKCLLRIRENPDVAKSEYSTRPIRGYFESSINTTATTVIGV